MNYGFIGSGNMATAIIKGMICGISPNNIFIYDKFTQVTENLIAKFSVSACNSEIDIINKCDVIILSVKPHILSEVALKTAETLSLLEKKPLIISIAAGKTLSDLENLYGESLPIIRVMPNINAQVGESMTAICGNLNTDKSQIKIASDLFGTVGQTCEITEKDFPTFMAIASCSPAFAYLFIDSLAKSAQKLGMSKQEAIRISAQALLGSSKTILESGEHPQVLIDQVCSPGGTTIEGVCTLQDYKFETAIVKAVESCVEKDAKMSANK